MFEERYGRAIDQIAVLIVCEDGGVQTFVKDKKDYIDYIDLLQPAIDEFWAEYDMESAQPVLGESAEMSERLVPRR